MIVHVYLVLLGASVAIGHPQCRDLWAPYRGDGQGFCSSVEIGGLTCCTESAERMMADRAVAFASILTEDCSLLVNQTICAWCHPYAEHVFTTPNGGVYPGLCSGHCSALQAACQGQSIPTDLINNLTVPADPTDTAFCASLDPIDSGYCFPEAPAITEVVEVTSDEHLCLQRVSSGWYSALAMVQPDDDLHRLAVIEQRGVVWMVDENDMQERYVFLDLRRENIMERSLSERGLLSIVFHPNYRSNGLFYIYHTPFSGVTVLAEYGSTSNLHYANAQTRRVLLTIAQPKINHNGGTLLFDRAGMLLLGLGDGGGTGDPYGYAQDKSELLGSVLRIDVTPSADKAYSIPSDNPFTGVASVRGEVFAIGMRSPWRCSIDRLTDQLLCGDVGGAQREKIVAINSNSNHGWPIWEGSLCSGGAACNTTTVDTPLFEYDHEAGHRSVTGGYVYRGCQYPLLNGSYVFGDWSSGAMFVLNASDWQGGAVQTGNKSVCIGSDDQEGILGKNILSFAEDLRGNLFVLVAPVRDAFLGETVIYRVTDPRLRASPEVCPVVTQPMAVDVATVRTSKLEPTNLTSSGTQTRATAVAVYVVALLLVISLLL